MDLFSKPVASIYVSEFQSRLDADIVPIFTPDTAVDVGDFGCFEGGRFVRRGNLINRGFNLGTQQRRVNPLEFASSGKVTIGPSVEIAGPAGQTMLKADIRFTKSRAVLASYQKGTEHSVPDADAFGDQLVQMWLTKELPTDRVVVWAVRKAIGGTVIVSQEGDNRVEVIADPSLLGPASITVSSLSVGVSFGAESKASWKMTSGEAEFVVWARLFRLDKNSVKAVDTFGFEATTAQHGVASRSVSYTSNELLGQL